jgi:hypothetical protein
MPEPVLESQPRKKYKFDIKSEARIFSWCILLAAILWLLTGLSENYVRIINVRTSYSNIPKDKVYVRPLPDDLKVQVNASGWDLFNIWLRGNAEEVSIDMAQYNKKQYILTNSRLKEEIRSQFAHKMIINNIEPDTIYLAKEPKLSRRVPIALKLKVNCEKEYAIGERIKLSQEYVTVSGPQTLIKQIEYAETRDTIINDINKTSSFLVRLKQPPFANLSYDIQKVKVTVPVFELTEAKYTVPVDIINKRSKYSIQLIPKNVTVIYQTTINKYKHINTSLFEAVVDGSQLDTSGKKLLRVQLVNHPEFTYNFRLKPENVNFIIKK